MELVLADGSELTVDGGDELRAARVGLGALGVVAAVTLRCVPAFRLHAVDRPLPLDDVLGELDRHVDGNDHFELFTFPHSPVALTRTNNRSDARAHPAPPAPRVGAGRRARQPRVRAPQPHRAARAEDDPDASTGSPAAAPPSASGWPTPSTSSPARGSCASRRWSTRCRASTPSRRCAPRAQILERYPVSFPIELRFSAGDDALLSPAHARESAYVAVHVFEGMSFEAPFREVEAVMGEWGGRPHWGKRSFLSAAELAPRYPRWADFAAIRERLDPDGRFVNAWARQTLL